MQTVISLGAAERLHELGLRHPIGVGDSYMEDDRGPYLYPWQTPTSYVKSTYLWLPRLDQVMDEIERLVPVADIRFGAPGLHPELRFCEVSYPMRGYVHMVGPHDTEAAGLVLVRILETL